jgi:hypothetical protein
VPKTSFLISMIHLLFVRNFVVSLLLLFLFCHLLSLN